MRPSGNAKRRGQVVALLTEKGRSLELPSFFGHGSELGEEIERAKQRRVWVRGQREQERPKSRVRQLNGATVSFPPFSHSHSFNSIFFGPSVFGFIIYLACICVCDFKALGQLFVFRHYFLLSLKYFVILFHDYECVS